MMKPITLSFSPCPNDTFMFDAMIHHKVDTEGLEFEVSYRDIETLNQQALLGKPDITKLSSKALSLVLENYIVLNSGAALGFGVGPLLLSKTPLSHWQSQISELRFGIPGKLTTANFLLDFAFPGPKTKIEMVFSEIEDGLLNDKIDIGLVIHESRFTYQKRGLNKLLDLGTYWEEKTGLPIPLAGIVVKKTLSHSTQLKIERILRKSIAFAFANPHSSLSYVQEHSREMEPEVVQNHIRLYVNEFSLDLGISGKVALLTLLKTFDPGLKEDSIFLR
jgi:1,4-dihydroxy-6-naphthoate synthase